MHTFADLTRMLNRPAIQLRSLQSRFALPLYEGASYSDAYLAFLRKIIHLRILGASESALLQLWAIEKKLLILLHADSAGSPTWFLDACAQTSHPNRRLLLSNHDLGVDIASRMIQPGLNFAAALPELFAGKDMGEDLLRVMEEYLKKMNALRDDVTGELTNLRSALAFARRVVTARAMSCGGKSDQPKT